MFVHGNHHGEVPSVRTPAKIEPSGKNTVFAVPDMQTYPATPSEPVVCKRGLASGHGPDAVAAMREPGDPAG